MWSKTKNPSLTSQGASEGTLVLWMKPELSQAAATLDTPQAAPEGVRASLTDSSSSLPSPFYI